MYATLIVGGGPGGTGPLVWAAQNDCLMQWLAEGVAVVERSGEWGGTIGHYDIISDSLGMSYLGCLDPPARSDVFAPVREEEITRELQSMRDALPPLPLVGGFLRRLCGELRRSVEQSPVSKVFARSEARCLHLAEDGSVSAEISDADGKTSRLTAKTAIVALGGWQDLASWVEAELMPGVRLADVDPAKIMGSDAILQPGGFARAERILAGANSRRIMILGGSHSAFSVASVLLRRLREPPFGAGDVAIVLRKKPPIFYETQSQAEADLYGISDDDICSVTQRINRCGGLRGDGRALWRRLTRRPGTEPEERAQMLFLHSLTAGELRRQLDSAALVVPAFGYRARSLPIEDAEGRCLSLAGCYGMTAVGPDGRMLLADGSRIANVFGIGLGSGYRPWGRMGCETSFAGQQNSLWLYQHGLGGIIHEGVRACLTKRRWAV